MNRACPTCGLDFATDELTGDTVPFEENDKLFTLQFCSEACRDEYEPDD